MGNKKNKKKQVKKNPKIVKKKVELTPEESAKRTKKIIIIFVCVIVGIAVLLGSILGIIAAVRNASYVMKLENVGIDKGVTSYLVSYLKYVYMAEQASMGNNISDTPAYWNTVYYGQSTNGDLLKYIIEERLKLIISANVIFDNYTKLTSEDKNKIAVASDQILQYRADGNKDKFNTNAEKMGFDYKDFQKANEMLYKYFVVRERIFGQEGENLKNGGFSAECDEFFANYYRFKLIFIRTEDGYVLDEEGNRKKDENGNEILLPLTEAQKNEKLEYINELKECMKDINEGDESAARRFEELSFEIANKYDENIDSAVSTGYYFIDGSAYTARFNEEFPDVINQAMKLEVGECSLYESGATASEESENKFTGVCFIYRVAKEEKAYTSSAASHFFTDFYYLASQYVFSNMTEKYSEEVEVRDKWDEINPAEIPYNKDYIVKEF